MLEENFVNSMIKAEGDPIAFFNRPIAAALGLLTLLVWLMPMAMKMFRRGRAPAHYVKP